MDLDLTRTVTKLSDGRELIYYDETPGQDRSAADERDLPTVSTTSELRRDPLTGEVTAVAGHRQDRTFLPAADQCPLDPSRPGHLSEIPAADYDVAVFENRFPSLAGDTGRCEVVVFSAEHAASFGALPGRRPPVSEAWRPCGVCVIKRPSSRASGRTACTVPNQQTG